MSKKPDDDLFQDSVMSFGDHLNELRGCLWRAILGIAAGFIVGLFLANAIVRFIQLPLENALQRYYLDVAQHELRRINPDASDDEVALVVEKQMVFETVSIQPRDLAAVVQNANPADAGRLQFPDEVITASDLPNPKTLALAIEGPNPAAKRVWGQLSEPEQQAIGRIATVDTATTDDLAMFAKALNRLLDDRKLFDQKTFDKLLSAKDSEQLAKADQLSQDNLRHANWNLLVATFPSMLNEPHQFLEQVRIWKPITDDPRTRTKSFSGQEAFMIWLKAALIAGVVLASPWVFYQLWMFVAAGLYPTEKKFVHVYLPFSIALFLAGVVMSTFVFPPMLKFFLSFNQSMGIEPEPRISEWLSFVLFLPLGFGLAFQLPLVMLFLERIGLFTVSSYLKQWRLAVLVIWIIAAVATPSDPISIFYLAMPLMLLFFGGIMLCKWWPSERNKNLQK
ncbi:MAG TPA: twin-arginine translocase subunit TatC, partial [Pirellulales bacterium]